MYDGYQPTPSAVDGEMMGQFRQKQGHMYDTFCYALVTILLATRLELTTPFLETETNINTKVAVAFAVIRGVL